jgi:L-ascorbate metabolism protein UlaG (beta-lactamase superfamily)
MLTLRRINDDSSWSLQFGDTHCLLDPWLVGDDINLAPWFSRQRLTAATLPLEQIPAVDCILISHPFSDHCSEQTLALFPAHIPVFAVPTAAHRIKQMQHFARVEPLLSWNHTQGVQVFGKMEITYFSSARLIDPTHNAFLLRNTESNESVFYAPHGFVIPAKSALHNQLQNSSPDLLMTTFRHYGLPFFLGGTVNLGSEFAITLIKILKPKSVIRTHDAHKEEHGLVTQLAHQWIHPDPQAILNSNGVLLPYRDASIGEIINV